MRTLEEKREIARKVFGSQLDAAKAEHSRLMAEARKVTTFMLGWAHRLDTLESIDERTLDVYIDDWEALVNQERSRQASVVARIRAEWAAAEALGLAPPDDGTCQLPEVPEGGA